MRRRVKGLEFGRKKERKINLSLFQEIMIWILEIAVTIAIGVVFTYFFGVRSTVVGPNRAKSGSGIPGPLSDCLQTGFMVYCKGERRPPLQIKPKVIL